MTTGNTALNIDNTIQAGHPEQIRNTRATIKVCLGHIIHLRTGISLWYVGILFTQQM